MKIAVDYFGWVDTIIFRRIQHFSADNGEEEYEPPKADVTVIKEDDAFYSKR